MRLLLITVFLLFVLALSGLAADEEPRCEQCGMFFLKSPTQITATVAVGDEEATHLFESFGCYIGNIAEHYDANAEVTSVTVLDYHTFGTEKLQMLDASEASYLYGTARLKGSMAPFIAAFADDEAAQTAQAELGGELVDFAGMLHQLSIDSKVDCQAGGLCAACAGEKPAEGDSAAEYICPCSGGCCDDISSAEPGECPRCGMQLVKG